MGQMFLWTLIGLDLILLFFGFYMASYAVGIVGSSPTSPAALGVAALFLALPVFCMAAPYAAWRSTAHGGGEENGIALAAMPIVYAAFLTLFTFWQ